ELAVAVLPGAREISRLRTLPRGREQRLHGEDSRYQHRGYVAPVDFGALVRNDFSMERRRVAVVVPTFHAKAPLQPLDGRRLADVRVLLRAAERAGVHERKVGKITQVVDDEQIVGVVVEVGGYALPLRVVQVRQIDDLCRIRQRRLAHPDPDERTALHRRVAAYPQPWGNHILTRDLHTFAGAVVLDPVIHAADGIALATAVRQQCAAMRTAIVERDHSAAVAPIEQDVLPQQGAAQESAIDELVVDGGYVPTVPEKHGARLQFVSLVETRFRIL